MRIAKVWLLWSPSPSVATLGGVSQVWQTRELQERVSGSVASKGLRDEILEVWQGKDLGGADSRGWELEGRRREEKEERPGTSWQRRPPEQRSAIVEFTHQGSTYITKCQ